MKNEKKLVSDLDNYYMMLYVTKISDKDVKNWFDNDKVKLGFESHYGRINYYIDYYTKNGFTMKEITIRLVNISKMICDKPHIFTKYQLAYILLLVDRYLVD